MKRPRREWGLLGNGNQSGIYLLSMITWSMYAHRIKRGAVQPTASTELFAGTPEADTFVIIYDGRKKHRIT